MKTVHKSVLIWYSPQEMYVLVTDVNRYAEFLPWCEHARVVEEHPDGMTAEMGIAFGGVRQNFSTRNVHTPASRVDMQLLNGPFSQLDGHWQFSPVGDGTQRACKVEQKGYTLVPINLHWKSGKVKCEIALAKGKAEHDKRDTIKDREGKREVERAMKSRNR